MTNEKIEIKTEEEIKENRFMKHLKKHREKYGVIVGSGVTALGMSLLYNSRLKEISYESYMRGGLVMHEVMWNYLAEHVKDGVLKLELLKATDDEDLKNNMKILKQALESKED